MLDFDVIVIGGGPAGASAAIHLAASGARVLLAERASFPRAKLCGEFISPECLEHFARLGVLGGMELRGGERVSETVFYAPSGRNVAVPSTWFGSGGGAALGLSRAEMDDQLLRRARAVGVQVLEESALAGVVVEDGRVRGVRLHTHEGVEREFRARVTLDATGRQRAAVRRAEREMRASTRGVGETSSANGIGESAGTRGASEQAERHFEGARERASLVAFKAHLEGAAGAAGACEIYFYAGGYGGLSPVEGGLSNLCFIARARDVRARGSDPERVMREVLMLNRRAAHTLAGACAKTRWLGVAVESFGRYEPAPFEGMLAVGDAAAFIDPFTGSGMLMALEGGELAARAVSRWLAQHGEPVTTEQCDARIPPTCDTRALQQGNRDASRQDATRAAFAALARDYRAAYGARFDARLRLCGLLRRAALAPARLAEVGVFALGASAAVRRRLARATRGGRVLSGRATRGAD
jgi:flavin-dependent dehydrogenase